MLWQFYVDYSEKVLEFLHLEREATELVLNLCFLLAQDFSLGGCLCSGLALGVTLDRWLQVLIVFIWSALWDYGNLWAGLACCFIPLSTQQAHTFYVD